MTTATRSYLDLHMPIDPNGSVSATAPLAWCVTRTLRDELEAAEFTNPHLLVIVRAQKRDGVGSISYNEWFDRRAFVVPLTNAMVYTSFNTDGAHEIHAYVINIPNKDEAKRVKGFINHVEESGLEYGISSAVMSNGELYVPVQYSMAFLRNRSESMNVHVPANMFAPPPAEWRQRIVKKYFKNSKAVDQCHFRKRFWFAALPLSFLVVPALYVMKAFLAVLGTFVGVRGYNWRVFKKPLGPVTDLWESSNVWFAPLEDREHEDGLGVWTFLNGIVLTVVGLVVLLFMQFDAATSLTIIGAILAAAALGAVGFFVYCSDAYNDWSKNRDARQAEEYRIKTLKDLESMLCETGLPANSVADLPREKQTVSLRFYDFKTKVCKPFAR